MRYVIDMSIEDDEQSVELSGLPLIPQPGDTLEIRSVEGPVVGVVKDRHFAYEAPDVCRVAIACKKL